MTLVDGKRNGELPTVFFTSAMYCTTTEDVFVSSTVFYRTSCQFLGGGVSIYTKDYKVEFDNCIFLGCSSTESSGGISAKAHTFLMKSSCIMECFSRNGDSAMSLGGYGYSDVRLISNSIFQSPECMTSTRLLSIKVNQANVQALNISHSSSFMERAIGLRIQGFESEVDFLLVTNNQAKSLLFLERTGNRAIVSFIDCIFINNSGLDRGHFITTYKTYVLFRDCQITGNDYDRFASKETIENIRVSSIYLKDNLFSVDWDQMECANTLHSLKETERQLYECGAPINIIPPTPSRSMFTPNTEYLLDRPMESNRRQLSHEKFFVRKETERIKREDLYNQLRILGYTQPSFLKPKQTTPDRTCNTPRPTRSDLLPMASPSPSTPPRTLSPVRTRASQYYQPSGQENHVLLKWNLR